MGTGGEKPERDLSESKAWFTLFFFFLQGNSIKVDLKVLVPDRSIVTVTLAKNTPADKVYESVVQKIDLAPETTKCFALFEIVEYSFGESRFPPKEYLPHSPNSIGILESRRTRAPFQE